MKILQWLSVEEHEMPLETPILVEHEFGIEAIHFWNGFWRYWYSGTIVSIDVLQTAKYFAVVKKVELTD